MRCEEPSRILSHYGFKKPLYVASTTSIVTVLMLGRLTSDPFTGQPQVIAFLPHRGGGVWRPSTSLSLRPGL